MTTKEIKQPAVGDGAARSAEYSGIRTDGAEEGCGIRTDGAEEGCGIRTDGAEEGCGIRADGTDEYSGSESSPANPDPGQPYDADLLRETGFAYGARIKKQGEYTLDDYYALPDERRAELIDGWIYDMGAPTNIHQILVSEIHAQLMDCIRQHHRKCIAMGSPADVQLDCDNRTMLQPDLLIVCDRSKIRLRCVYGAPDLVIEILSPSTRKRDTGLKYVKYLNAGVREYWIIYPDEKKILVYDFEHESVPAIYGPEDRVPVGISGGKCSVDFREVFAQAAFLYEETQD